MNSPVYVCVHMCINIYICVAVELVDTLLAVHILGMLVLMYLHCR
jgi:hypothetical protein